MKKKINFERLWDLLFICPLVFICMSLPIIGWIKWCGVNIITVLASAFCLFAALFIVGTFAKDVISEK